jgi:AbiU2
MKRIALLAIGGIVGWIIGSKPKAKRALPEPLPLASRFRSAVITLTVAKAAYDVWWTYIGEGTRDLEAVNEFPTFFRYDEEANFRAMIVSVHTLFDDTPGTLTVKSLIKALPADVAKPIERKYVPLKQAAKKVGVLRHNWIAHRNAAKSDKTIFAEAGLKPDDVGALIEGTREVLNLIAPHIGASEPTLSPFVRDETLALFSRIKRNQRSA